MNRFILKFIVILIIGILPNASNALTFSKDSITAYDGKLWNGGFGDDSMNIINNSASIVTIDSILIQIDTSLYNHFNIGWAEIANGTGIIMRFCSDSTVSNVCSPYSSIVVVNIKDYNSGKSSKLSIAAHSMIKVESPYFSTNCPNVGIFVDCFGDSGCYPNMIANFSHFSGRIIFISNKHRDTLHLLCERERWTTGVIKKTSAISPTLHSCNHPLVNILGRKTSFANKLTAYHSLSVRKGNVVFLKQKK